MDKEWDADRGVAKVQGAESAKDKGAVEEINQAPGLAATAFVPTAVTANLTLPVKGAWISPARNVELGWCGNEVDEDCHFNFGG